MLTDEQVAQFVRDGYCVLPGAKSPAFCQAVIAYAQAELAADRQPIEYEADVAYPGAPESKTAPGGGTARRLLNAVTRAPFIREFATSAELKTSLQQLLGEQVYLSIAHHNCIMTKQPKYSSHTGWHRDSRYWHYPEASLVSVWVALADEFRQNGCLWVIPGSHQWQLGADRFDAKKFLDADNPANDPLIAQAIAVELAAGDMLLFHSNLFHAAGNNITERTKYSLVLTYRDASNTPIAGTRSATMGEIAL